MYIETNIFGLKKVRNLKFTLTSIVWTWVGYSVVLTIVIFALISGNPNTWSPPQDYMEI